MWLNQCTWQKNYASCPETLCLWEYKGVAWVLHVLFTVFNNAERWDGLELWRFWMLENFERWQRKTTSFICRHGSCSSGTWCCIGFLGSWCCCCPSALVLWPWKVGRAPKTGLSGWLIQIVQIVMDFYCQAKRGPAFCDPPGNNFYTTPKGGVLELHRIIFWNELYLDNWWAPVFW